MTGDDLRWAIGLVLLVLAMDIGTRIGRRL